MMQSIRDVISTGSRPVIGSWLALGNEAIAEILCKADYEWLCIDIEHTCCSLETTERLVRTIDLSGKKAFVRLSSNDTVQIKRVMDCGAHGLIVPMVNSKDDVLKAYRAMHFPPLGIRGVGLARAQKYGPGFNDYHESMTVDVPLVIQIEHKDALGNLEEIFSCSEIDAYIIGPYDLSASMGIPGQFEHPDLLQALNKIKDVANKYNKTPGFHIVEPDVDQLKTKIKEGYKLIAYSVDFRMIDATARLAFEEIQKEK